MKHLLIGSVVAAFCVTATDCGSAPSEPAGSVPGAWTASTSTYSQIRVYMTERPDDHVLMGNWAGDRKNCTGAASACRDSGLVFDGLRSGNVMTFGLTALNGTRSLAINGTIAADSSIVGTAKLTDNGTRSAAEAITLRTH